MIKTKQTTNNVWWLNEGEDFPSLNMLKEFNDSFTDSIYKLSFTGQFTAQVIINAKDLNITAFKTINNFDIQTYIVKSIHKKTLNGNLVLNLVVDTFSSFGYKLLELPNNFLTKRTHKFNKLSFQMEDGLLNSIPVYYDKNVVVEKRYPSMTGDSTNTSNQTRIRVISKTLGTFYTDIQNPDNNANIYYTFGCGTDIKDTTKFTLLPYLGDVPSLYLPKPSETLETIIFNSKSKWEDVLTKIKAYQDKHFTVKLVVEPNFNLDFDFINYYNSYDYDYTIPSNKISIKLEDKIKYWDYLGYNPAINKFQGFAYTINNINVNMNGRNLSGSNEKSAYTVFTNDTPILPEKDYPINNTWEDETNNYIKLTIIGQKRYNSNIVLKNTLRNINELLKNPELINKFQGIFFLPNLTNFTVIDPRDNVGVFKDFITVEIGPEGIDLPNFSICNQIKLNNFQEYKLKWNNDFITSILFLKYFDITYYSNSKNWNFYFDFDTTSINLSGKFTFNGVGSIVSNIGIDKTYNNIIEFPYQLPSALDQYTKYYSGIMNSTNTGMEAQKKNYEISKAQLGMNTALSAISAAPSIAGNIASGNLIGGVGDVIGMGSGLGNSLLESQKMDLGNSMYYKNLGAKFSDVQRTQSTNFSNSSITDLSFLFSNTGKFNSEQIQMKSLTKDTIINVNNHLYLYGYQNVGWYNWEQLSPYDNFNFVEFEHNELVRIILNDLDFKVKNIYELVINFWDKGRRIWNKKPNKEENILKVSFRNEK